MARIEPAVTQIMYDIPDGISYIDLAKDLSIVNRRAYRQGYTYVIQDIQMHSVLGIKHSDITLLEFATAGNSWIVHNAWTKGFHMWRDQVRDVEQIGVMEGRWNDYKVYLDDHMEDGTTLAPLDGDGNAYLVGDWDYSAVVFDDDGVERDLKMHLIGASNLADTNEESGIGLVYEYSISRPYITGSNDEEPDVSSSASDSIYAKMLGTDELTDRLVQNIEEGNDLPPYDEDNYPGGADNADAPVPTRIMSCTGGQGSASVSGFIVPCGLLKVENSEIQQNGDFLQDATIVTNDTTSSTARVIITLAAGPYRGVLASKMGQ